MPAAFEPYLGAAAGIAASVLWTFTALFFTSAGKRLGATVVNAYRIAVAIVLLTVTHRFMSGCWIPQALPNQVYLLALSGVIGLTLGDQVLFMAFLAVGPRLSMLIMTTSPIFAALLGWICLDETLPPMAWAGVLLVIGGVSWVILERPRRTSLEPTRPVLRGLTLALIGSACQAGGLLLSKQGMGHGWADQDQYITPQTATLIRMSFAGLGMAPLLAFSIYRRRMRRTGSVQPQTIGSRKTGYLLATAGASVGPYLGVWMSLVALDRAPLGIAQTLCSLTPIFILPFSAFLHKEYISIRAVAGAFIAIGGSALLFFIR